MKLMLPVIVAYSGCLVFAETSGVIDSRKWPWWLVVLVGMVVPAIWGHVATAINRRKGEL